MAILWDAAASPDEITYAIRQIPLRSELTLSAMPGMITYTRSNSVRWGEITRKNRLAKYRAFDGPIAVSGRDGAEDRQVRLAPFSKQHNLGEFERLSIEYERMAGGNRAVLADALYDDAADLTYQMQNRVEKAIAETLYTGIFDVNENGFRGRSDFGIPTANKFVASTPWTDPAAKIGDDLRAWSKQFLKSAGVRAGRIITSEYVIDLIMHNAQVVAEVVGTQAGRAWITREELDRWLGQNRLPALVTEYETSFYDEDTASEQRVIPENRIIFTPANLSEILNFTFGISATALELIRSNRSEMSWDDGAGIVGLAIKQGPPFRQFTFTDAVGMPLLTGPRSVVIGQVTA